MRKIYWDHNGHHQDWYEAIKHKIPLQGQADELHIDLLRNAVNLYHDLYNNGFCNWSAKEDQFWNIKYNATRLRCAAQGEQVLPGELDAILGTIERIGNAARDRYVTKKEEEELAPALEKLADIIIRYAWEREDLSEP